MAKCTECEKYRPDAVVDEFLKGKCMAGFYAAAPDLEATCKSFKVKASTVESKTLLDCLVCGVNNPKNNPDTRKFDTGATRDTTEGKLDYRKALSPIVLQRYVQYLDAHRKQPDGSMRDFDDWKQGIPIEAYFEGLGRHEMAVWLLHDGFPAEDNHGPVTLEATLCAIIFNSSGWLHEILKEKACGKIT